jgi:hypothetical protein
MKDNSLKTGTYLRNILAQDSDFQQLITIDKLVPIIALPDTKYPIVTYTRENIYPQYTKAAPAGGWSNDLQYTFRVYTGIDGNAYDLGIDIANAIRNALEWTTYKDEDLVIHPIELISSTEYFADDSYVQQLTFKIVAE